MLAALGLSYGTSTNAQRPEFPLPGNYLLTPDFDERGILIKISIHPKFGPGSSKSPPLERMEFDAILANLNSIKPLGTFEEVFPGEFVHGGRSWVQKRYEHAYLQTAEEIGTPPRKVAFVYIYYIHPVTGTGKMPRDSRPEDAGSFGSVCFNNQGYIAPKGEFLKLFSAGKKELTLDLAGPTGDRPPECGN